MKLITYTVSLYKYGHQKLFSVGYLMRFELGVTKKKMLKITEEVQ